TLDLHAMVSPAMVELAQILVSYKTYPHIVMREIGMQAGRILDRAMRGDVHPRTLRGHVPMLDEANAGRTDVPETAAQYARARAHEAEPRILAGAINSGLAEAHHTETGPTVLVTHDDGCGGRVLDIATGLARSIWDGRGKVANTFLTPAEAAARARDFDPTGGPLVIADYADNPGAGAYGDATALLEALLEAGAAPGAFAPMIDAEAAALLHRHKVGDSVTLDLGGKCDPSFGGGPLRLTGEVR